MGYILKQNKQIADSYGNTYENCYAVIDKVLLDKEKKNATIVLKTYKDRNARINNLNALFIDTYFVEEDFDVYFPLDTTIWDSAYIVLTDLYIDKELWEDDK